MIINNATLDALRTGFRTEFQNALQAVEPSYRRVATVVPSTTKSNTYGWLGQWPGFREWVGDRIFKSMREHAYAIQNKTWESSVDVLRDDIEDDNLGQYSLMFQEMGRATAVFPDELVWPMLAAGFDTACYDGQYFFDTDHPINAEVDGTGADTSFANCIIDGGYVGEPWYLLDTRRVIKPIIYQDRRAPAFTARDNPNDENVFIKNTYQYGVDLRSNAGYGLWQLAFGVKDELNFDNVWAAYEGMVSVKADGGRPLAVMPNLLVVSRANERKARETIEKQRLANGEDNILYNKFEIQVVDYL